MKNTYLIAQRRIWIYQCTKVKQKHNSNKEHGFKKSAHEERGPNKSMIQEHEPNKTQTKSTHTTSMKEELPTTKKCQT